MRKRGKSSRCGINGGGSSRWRVFRPTWEDAAAIAQGVYGIGHCRVWWNYSVSCAGDGWGSKQWCWSLRAWETSDQKYHLQKSWREQGLRLMRVRFSCFSRNCLKASTIQRTKRVIAGKEKSDLFVKRLLHFECNLEVRGGYDCVIGIVGWKFMCKTVLHRLLPSHSVLILNLWTCFSVLNKI